MMIAITFPIFWGEIMNPKNIEQAKNPDLPASLIAIKRAAKRAAQLAISTNTKLVVMRDGKCVRVQPEQV
jgi:hypothetical protein